MSTSSRLKLYLADRSVIIFGTSVTANLKTSRPFILNVVAFSKPSSSLRYGCLAFSHRRHLPLMQDVLIMNSLRFPSDALRTAAPAPSPKSMQIPLSVQSRKFDGHSDPTTRTSPAFPDSIKDSAALKAATHPGHADVPWKPAHSAGAATASRTVQDAAG